MAQDITVSHCIIYDMPRTGINIADGCWGGHSSNTATSSTRSRNRAIVVQVYRNQKLMAFSVPATLLSRPAGV